ncbi:MAG: tail fiber domain-containing protein [Dysgonamonadaceae bacterium]|jgi:hypothetical protein|nr:tail fiber domain-containing protein [Dysgonamonadaceae bacterium]
MKTIQKNLLVGFLLLCYAAANAQLKVDADGRVLVGTPISGNDPEKAAILQVFGKSNSQYASGGKLTFGDFGRQTHNGWNVFIGEYGTTDTDQLWLHGKLGTYFTYNNGTSVWGYYDVNVGNAFYFNCNVYSNGVLLTSDDRRKENIRPLSGSLLSLQQLKGVSYSLKPVMQASTNAQKADGKTSDKERRDRASLEAREKELQNSKDPRMGFVAQELKKVFPELVREDRDGMLSVDYIGLVPVIVESIKEQQQIINVQSEKINALEKAIETLQGKSLSLIAPDGKGADTKQTGLTQ